MRALQQTACLLAATLLLGGCSVLDKPVRPAVFDFGPGSSGPVAAAAASAAPVALAEVEAAGAFDSTALLYRLAYADAQQLQPYAQARWSMPPAQLLQQRLRQSLVQQYRVVREDDTLQPRPMLLRVAIDEFSQVFAAPADSAGLVRVHASVVQAGPAGERLLAQHSFVAQRPAPSADAPGGVRALTAASDAVVAEIAQWLRTLP